MLSAHFTSVFNDLLSSMTLPCRACHVMHGLLMPEMLRDVNARLEVVSQGDKPDSACWTLLFCEGEILPMAPKGVAQSCHGLAWTCPSDICLPTLPAWSRRH